MTAFTGSNPERQSVGLPGHCEACADQGHVDAHPDLGCSDVGCHSVHPEPVEEPAAQDPMLAAALALGHPVPPPADEHPAVTEMREREAAALVRGYTDGDVNHNVQPVIGIMRLQRSKGELPDADDLDEWIPRLFAACDAENAVLAERKAARLASEGAPPVAMIYPAGRTRGHQVVSGDWPGKWETAVPGYVWNLLRDAAKPGSGNADIAPVGWLYTATGAQSLDDIFERMWTCPEADALRAVPHTSEQYREPHLTTMEQAQFAMNDFWAGFLGGDLT